MAFYDLMAHKGGKRGGGGLLRIIDPFPEGDEVRQYRAVPLVPGQAVPVRPGDQAGGGPDLVAGPPGGRALR